MRWLNSADLFLLVLFYFHHIYLTNIVRTDQHRLSHSCWNLGKNFLLVKLEAGDVAINVADEETSSSINKVICLPFAEFENLDVDRYF